MPLPIRDRLVTVLNYLSTAPDCLGCLDQAHLRSEAAVEEARKLGHAFSLANALHGACRIDWAMGPREELLARMT